MNFHIITFGCQMNVHDSDWLARALAARGWVPTDEDAADVFIVNTCSVREKPEQKVYSTLGRIAARLDRKPGMFAAVCGCVAQQIGQGFFERFPFVRLVFGTDGMAGAPDALIRVAKDRESREHLLDFLPHYPERESAPPAPEQGLTSGQAFVNIMQGCDNFCTYCIVPYVRGRQKSRAPEAVLDECRMLVDNGVREITLLGQNVNSYGLDKGGRGTGFAELLRLAAGIPGLERLRFTTSHPKDIDPEVIGAFARFENLCPHLHLPVQSGSDRILRRMGRGYDRAAYLDIVARLRAARPDIALTTDIIVGFPGETEEDFLDTMSLVREVGYEGAFSFKYSDRPGTAAARMDPKVPEEEGADRLARLQAEQEALTQKCLSAQVGRDTLILIEGPSRRQGEGAGLSWKGRDPAGRIVNVACPEIRGLTGKCLRTTIIEAKKHSLVGKKAGEPW